MFSSFNQSQCDNQRFVFYNHNPINTLTIIQIPFIGKLQKNHTIIWKRLKQTHKETISSNHNHFFYQCSPLDLDYTITAQLKGQKQVQILYPMVNLNETHIKLKQTPKTLLANLIKEGIKKPIHLHFLQGFEISGTNKYELNINEIFGLIQPNHEKFSIILFGLSRFKLEEAIYNCKSNCFQATEIVFQQRQQFLCCLYRINRLRTNILKQNAISKSKPSLETQIKEIDLNNISNIEGQNSLPIIDISKAKSFFNMKKSQNIIRETKNPIMQSSLSLKGDSFVNYFSQFQNILFEEDEKKNPQTLNLFNSFQILDTKRNREEEEKIVREIEMRKPQKQQQIQKLIKKIEEETKQKERLEQFNLSLKRDIKRAKQINTFTDISYINNLRKQIESMRICESELKKQIQQIKSHEEKGQIKHKYSITLNLINNGRRNCRKRTSSNLTTQINSKLNLISSKKESDFQALKGDKINCNFFKISKNLLRQQSVKETLKIREKNHKYYRPFKSNIYRISTQ